MKQKGLICITLMLFIIATITYAQQQEELETTTVTTTQIEWLSFEEVEEKLKTEERKLIVDIYRDGCGWCKKMEAETFQDPVIVDYINQNYYAVKLNGEQAESITFQGETYNFVKTGNGKRGYNELAIKITRGEQGLPSVVFMDEKVNVIQSFSGYKEVSALEKLITYFAENHHLTTPWVRYEAIYQPLDRMETQAN